MPANAPADPRQRRDIASGRPMGEAAMIRYVLGPDGQVVPDLARKLPGRGLWVAATAEATALAARKGLFARIAKNAAAKTRAAAPAELADIVAERLRQRLLAGLGLARKAGWLLCGFETCSDAAERGRAAVLIEAVDGARDGRRRIMAAARRAHRAPRLVGLFTSGEMGLALGAEIVIHAAFLAGRGADRWMLDLERLSGFRPLFPKSWGPEIWVEPSREGGGADAALRPGEPARGDAREQGSAALRDEDARPDDFGPDRTNA